MDEVFNTDEAIKAQAAYCKEKQAPHFAPKNGYCWCCNQNIYAPGRVRWKGQFEARESAGISVEKAGKELVTGCPHCYRSYCD